MLQFQIIIFDFLYFIFVIMIKHIKKEIWLFISAFGIMFAVFSWIQESNIIPSVIEFGWLKGLCALITGFILYISFRQSL